NAIPPSLPGPIAQLITSINGLDNSTIYAPRYRSTSSLPKHVAMPAGYASKDLVTAYDAAPLQNGGILGNNQTIALFELDGYQMGDITQYTQANNLGTPNISNVLVDGFSGSAGQGAVEVELDIEVVAAMAPHANQLVYEGPNTTQGLNDTYNKIVTDNKAQIATISWGLCENSTGAKEVQTLDNIFKQGAAQGISFFAASGDSGAYDCADTNLAVDTPASDPYVTGVGGTSLQVNAGAYSSESVWSDPGQIQRGPKGGGSGGGISSIFKQPAWQTGPNVQNSYSNGNRQVPDVSADADITTGYSIYCTVKNAGCPPTGWLTVGGTSAAAPLWAGSAALINQYLQSQGQKRMGGANAALYRLFNAQQAYPAFHDVTTGNNLFYPATPNYDLASGLGSPDIYNIARDFVALSSGGMPNPTPSPASSIIQNGSFEAGQSPWQSSSSGSSPLIDSTNVYDGQYSASLCGYTNCNDKIWQLFTVPSSYTSLTLNYWWYSDSNKTTKKCLDAFSSQLQNGTDGTVIRTVQQACNLNPTTKWIQQSFDISADLAPYKGQQVSLIFQGTTAPNLPHVSTFYIDAVTMTMQ
ncbi:MAG: S53 family peptidase, partial [Chloroflexota bacterium]|nr:S53 family peptidase [Chloroflexota bacterium]